MAPKTEHYINQLLPGLLTSPPEQQALHELLKAREMETVPDYYYPHHASSFPADHFNTEKALIDKLSLNKDPKPEIMDLIIEHH